MNKKDIVSQIRKKQIYKMQYIFLKTLVQLTPGLKFLMKQILYSETIQIFAFLQKLCWTKENYTQRHSHTRRLENHLSLGFVQLLILSWTRFFDLITLLAFPYWTWKKIHLKYRWCVLYFNKLRHSLRQS